MELFYEYPDKLYCIYCDKDVKPEIDDRIDKYEYDTGLKLEAPCKIAICPKCGKLLCEKDADYALLRLARFVDECRKM